MGYLLLFTWQLPCTNLQNFHISPKWQTTTTTNWNLFLQTEIYSDGEEFGVQEGSLIRVEPEAERAIAAGAKGMTYICIQAANGSLKQYTMTDGRLGDSKASWM